VPAGAPRFSILLPTHDRADVLPFAIRSILAQTVADFEVLVVADGCTDGTADVVRSFGDARIHLFEFPKGPGFGYAHRNRALREARGDLVAFLAHDDLWTADHLERAGALLDRTGAAVGATRPLWVVAPGLLVPVGFRLDHPATLAAFLGRRRNLVPAGCVVHRREALDRVGGWNDALPAGADWDLWVRIASADGGRVASDDAATCLHFRADWREEPAFARVWRMYAAVEGFLPPGLRVEAPSGTTEQEAAWRAMERDPEGFARRLREGVAQVLDARLEESDRHLAAALAGREGIGAEEAAAALAEAAWVGVSPAWRLVRAARRAREGLFPAGSRRRRILDRATAPLRGRRG
jgi:hypothetical protein